MRPRQFGRHARHDFAEQRVTVAELLARRDAENSRVKVQASRDWERARRAAEEAPTLTMPIVDAEVVDAVVPPLRRIPSYIVGRGEQHGSVTKVLVSVPGLEGGAR